jgi:hypothetical protein
MKHVHSLRFEALDTRQLLSTAHVAVAHAAAAPLVLNGTLTVDNNPDVSSTTMNVDGSMTTSVPVAGQLGALGQVHGVWRETVDAYGDYEGPDELILHGAKGSFGVGFNDAHSKPAHAKVRGAITYEHAQRVLGGAGAYAKESESGSIELTTNAARTHIVSLTLRSRNL